MSNPKPDWLFMVYMVAGDQQLDSLAVQDLLEIERALAKNARVSALVEIKRRWPDQPQRFIIADGKPATPVPLGCGATPAGRTAGEDCASRLSPDGVLNMGDPAVLLNFMLAGLTDHAGPETKFALVLWGHSFGLGFGRDHGDPLKLVELERALNAFANVRGGMAFPAGEVQENDPIYQPHDNERVRLELLGANTCVMSYAEAIFQLRKSAQYMVASEVFVPFAGWPYDRVLSDLRSNPDVEDVAKLIVNRYIEFYDDPGRDERVAMSVIALNRADPIALLLQDLAAAISSAVSAGSEYASAVLKNIQDAFLANPAGTIRPVLDLKSLAMDLKSFVDSDDTHDRKAQTGGQRKMPQRTPGPAEALAQFVSSPADGAGPKRSRMAGNGPLPSPLLYHRAHRSLENMHGIGIFAPFVVDDGRLTRLREATAKERQQDPELARVHAGRTQYQSLAVFQPEVIDEEARRQARDPIFAGPGTKPKTWPFLVFDALSPRFDSDVVDANGIVRPRDRSDVNQMLFAVDASFRRLGRIVEDARRDATGWLQQWAMLSSPSERARVAGLVIRRLGPPRLRLGSLDLTFRRVAQLGASRRRAGETQVEEASIGPEALVALLERLETHLGHVERTTRRTMTDARFGIGPSAVPTGIASALVGKGQDPGLEDAKGQDVGLVGKGQDAGLSGKPMDIGLIDKSQDPGLGAPTDVDLGNSGLGSRLVWVSGDPEYGSVATAELFGLVGRVLSRLEQDVARIEAAVADVLMHGDFEAVLSPEDFAVAIHQRVASLFGRLEKTRQEALLTIRWVLEHPTFGLGPGLAGLGRRGRELLANKAGLSDTALRLIE